jgi:hypothetical protein
MMTVVYCKCGRYRAEVRELETRVLELVPGLPVLAVWPDPSPGCLTRWIRDNHSDCKWRMPTAEQHTVDGEEVVL